MEVKIRFILSLEALGAYCDQIGDGTCAKLHRKFNVTRIKPLVAVFYSYLKASCQTDECGECANGEYHLERYNNECNINLYI